MRLTRVRSSWRCAKAVNWANFRLTRPWSFLPRQPTMPLSRSRSRPREWLTSSCFDLPTAPASRVSGFAPGFHLWARADD
eukprot:scaffold226857_cov27-Tisochrysis_lutea.AAC.1